MSTSSQVLERSAKPAIAGVLNIVSGSFCLLAVLGLVIAAVVVAPFSQVGDLPLAVSALLIIIALPLALLGAVSVVGGVFSMQRRMWGWALAGSIATLLVSQLLGIISLVLTALSRREFPQ
jgi:hypothetical protein